MTHYLISGSNSTKTTLIKLQELQHLTQQSTVNS